MTDEEKFLASFESNWGSDTHQSAEHILKLVKLRKLEIQWPRAGQTLPTVCFVHQNNFYPVLVISISGTIQVPVAHDPTRSISCGNNNKAELFEKLRPFPGISILDVNSAMESGIQIYDLLIPTRLIYFSP